MSVCLRLSFFLSSFWLSISRVTFMLSNTIVADCTHTHTQALCRWSANDKVLFNNTEEWSCVFTRVFTVQYAHCAFVPSFFAHFRHHLFLYLYRHSLFRLRVWIEDCWDQLNGAYLIRIVDILNFFLFFERLFCFVPCFPLRMVLPTTLKSIN